MPESDSLIFCQQVASEDHAAWASHDQTSSWGGCVLNTLQTLQLTFRDATHLFSMYLSFLIVIITGFLFVIITLKLTRHGNRALSLDLMSVVHETRSKSQRVMHYSISGVAIS
jgi:hypothetical protein